MEPMTWIALALLVVSAVITAVITPGRGAGAKASTLGDLQLPTTAEGTPKAVIFGDCWSEDWTVLWYGDFDTQPIKSKGGKKG
jgi:hypothetical protein